MSATLIATGLGAGHGDRALFAGLDLILAPGDVVGLVGPNGSGKSTLLRILAGLERAETGSVRTAPLDALVCHLPQEPGARPGESVADFLGRRTGVRAASSALDAAADALAREEPGAGEVYAHALERWLALGGADLPDRAPAVTGELGLEVDLHGSMSALSGGQAARVGLASLLLSRYDILLLDEPTNDLDLPGLDRLESFVHGLRAPLVVVSHDREFLSRTVTSVLELDPVEQTATLFGGGYAAFLEERERAREHARELYEDFAETRTALEGRARMQRAWSDKGVREALRKATDPDKHGIHKRRQSAQKQAAKAKQTDRMIERLEAVDEPRKVWRLQLELAAAPRSGAVVATLRGAVVRRGGFMLGPVDLQVDWADRIALTGANGSGKTTLLACLLGRLPLDEGANAVGPGVVIGEMDQARGAFLGGEPLADAFRAALGGTRAELSPAEVRTLLAKFGLRAAHVGRPADSLSPGERTRAALALLQARGTNLLVLDEPTNHLDLPAIEQLEEALAGYPGTLLLVTHDRRMLDAVHTTRRIHVDAGRVTEGRQTLGG